MLELVIFGELYFEEIPKEFPKECFKNDKISPDAKTRPTILGDFKKI